jgi:hypothetical protein
MKAKNHFHDLNAPFNVLRRNLPRPSFNGLHAMTVAA